MTAPLIQTITLTRGDTYGATLTFDQAVSGFTVMRFTVRDTWATDEIDNTDAALTTTLVSAGTYTATLALTATETRGLDAGQYVYDVQVTTAAGAIYTTQRGILIVTPDVTR